MRVASICVVRIETLLCDVLLWLCCGLYIYMKDLRTHKQYSLLVLIISTAMSCHDHRWTTAMQRVLVAASTWPPVCDVMLAPLSHMTGEASITSHSPHLVVNAANTCCIAVVHLKSWQLIAAEIIRTNKDYWCMALTFYTTVCGYDCGAGTIVHSVWLSTV